MDLLESDGCKVTLFFEELNGYHTTFGGVIYNPHVMNMLKVINDVTNERK